MNPVSAFEKNCRPLNHLIAAGEQYPQAWLFIVDYRVSRVSRGCWPEWCYCPLSASYTAICQDAGTDRLPIESGDDIARLGGLAAWRVSQSIYRFNRRIYKSLIGTQVASAHCDVLLRMPEQCIYIETLVNNVLPIHGFFAFLEYNAKICRNQLWLLIDADMPDGPSLVPVKIELIGPLASGIKSAMSRMVYFDGINYKVADMVPGYVNLLLYLCTSSADIGAGPSNLVNRQTCHKEALESGSVVGWIAGQ